MGTKQSARGSRFQGLSRLDPRWGNATIRAKGANPEDSSYTSRGARSGVAEADQTSGLALKTSGPQADDSDLEVYGGRAGHPLPDAGGFLLRSVSAGDGVDEYAGHDGYQVITGWDGSLHFDTLGGPAHAAPVIRLLSGDLLAVLMDNEASHEVWRADADTGAWSNVHTMTLTPGTSNQHPGPALLQFPSGEVVYFYVDNLSLQVHARISRDDGSSWADYAHAILGGSADGKIRDLAVAYTRGRVVLIASSETGAVYPFSAEQWVSHDLGCTFSLVGEDWEASSAANERPGHVTLVGLPSGQVAMSYWWWDGGAGTERYSSRIIDPSLPGYSTTRSDFFATPNAPIFAESSAAMWADEDGTLYVLHEVLAGATAYTALSRSKDGGATWERQKSRTFNGFGGARPVSYRVASTGGRAAWVMRWTSASTSSPESVGVAWLGGHAWATVGTVDDNSQEFDGRSFLGWGVEHGGASRLGGCYLPFTSPAALGWNNITTGGVGALVAPGVWQITTAVDTLSYDFADPTNDPTTEASNCGFAVRVPSGGALATSDVALRVRVSDFDQPGAVNATWVNELLINFTTTGFRMYDAISGVQRGGDVTFDMTTEAWVFVALRGSATQGEAAVWFGRPGGPLRRLEVALTTSLLTSDHAANPTDPCRVWWGNMAAGTAVSEWSVIGFNFYAHAFVPKQATNFVSSWVNPTHVRPRDFSTIPALLLDRVKLQATDGPVRLAETWRIATRYDYGVMNLDPRLSPSPRVPWRSKVDGVLERIVWDLEGGVFTDAFLGNHALLFLLQRSNIKTAKILGWNVGGAAWDTLATLDASDGFQVLPWERAGTTLRPDNTQVGVGERYLWRNQHAGDTFDLNAGEEPLHKIMTNTEGAWRVDGGPAKVKQPTLWLERENLKGGDPSSGASGEIWSRDFGAVLREYDDRYERFALEIPAQSTADGYYEIGAFFPGDILVFGQQYDLGWVWTREFNTALSQGVDGSRRSRVDGPMRRSVELGWVETAVQAHEEQRDDPDPSWISSGSGGLPVASRGDVLRAVTGLLEQQDGPGEPVVYLSRIPDQPEGDHSPLLLTDRRRWLYGRIPTNPKLEALAARTGEGVDEVERLNRITIEEEV